MCTNNYLDMAKTFAMEHPELLMAAVVVIGIVFCVRDAWVKFS